MLCGMPAAKSGVAAFRTVGDYDPIMAQYHRVWTYNLKSRQLVKIDENARNPNGLPEIFHDESVRHLYAGSSQPLDVTSGVCPVTNCADEYPRLIHLVNGAYQRNAWMFPLDPPICWISRRNRTWRRDFAPESGVTGHHRHGHPRIEGRSPLFEDGGS